MSLGRDVMAGLHGLARSSSLRLALLLSVIFAAAMAVAIYIALDLGRDAVLDRVDVTLESMAASTVLEDARTANDSLILRAADDIDNLPRPFRRAVEDGGGTAELNGNFLQSDIWRVFVGEDSEGEPIMVAVPLEDSFEALELLGGTLWATVGAVILITLLLGAVTGVLAQRRVGRINRTLTALAAGDLHARTGQTKSRDDLDDIAGQLDQTAAALERLVAQTRNLSASIAHDLRTPLARLRARLEDLPHGDARGAALEEATKLSGIFDTIMRVARIEATQGRAGTQSVDLGEMVADLAETFAPVLEDAGKSLTTDLQFPATVQADRQMLVQALANLIQNALVHGGTHVSVFAHGRQIGVSDDGPGIDPSQFDNVIKPMVRLDAARGSDGSGLGLALVRAVADRHNAKLVLSKAKPSGLRVTLNLADL